MARKITVKNVQIMTKKFSEKDTVFVVAQNDLFAENVDYRMIKPCMFAYCF